MDDTTTPPTSIVTDTTKPSRQTIMQDRKVKFFETKIDRLSKLPDSKNKELAIARAQKQLAKFKDDNKA